MGPNEIQIRNRSNGVRVNNGLYSSPSTCAKLNDFYKRPDNDQTDYLSLPYHSVNEINQIVLQGIKGEVSNLRVNRNNSQAIEGNILLRNPNNNQEFAHNFLLRNPNNNNDNSTSTSNSGSELNIN